MGILGEVIWNFLARLVAQGFAQISGIYFMDNFLPFVYKTKFRIILVLWAIYNWEAEIIDIKTAFLYGDLEEEIYMKIPKGYSEYKGIDLNKKSFLILDHVLYQLVHAARQFYKKLIGVLVGKLKFIKCLNDPCLLMEENENEIIITCLYIDNTLCVGD